MLANARGRGRTISREVPSIEGDLVDDTHRDRSLALAGIVFVVLTLVGSPPAREPAEAGRLGRQDRQVRRRQGRRAPLGRVRGHAGRHRPARMARRGLATDAPGRRRGAAPRGGRRARCADSPPPCFTVAGVIMSTVAIVGVANIGPQGTRFFYLLFNGLGAAGCVALALFVGAFSTVIIESGVLPSGAGLARRADRARPPRRGWRHRVDARRLLLPRLRSGSPASRSGSSSSA